MAGDEPSPRPVRSLEQLSFGDRFDPSSQGRCRVVSPIELARSESPTPHVGGSPVGRAGELISSLGKGSMSRVVHAVTGRCSSGRRWRTHGLRAWRRVLVLGTVAVVAWAMLVQPAGAQRAPVTDTTPSARTTTGRGPNATGAIGFVLIGGWVLAGGLLFRQGRRRLAAHKALPAQSPVTDDGDSGGTEINEADDPDGEQPAVAPSSLPASAAPE